MIQICPYIISFEKSNFKTSKQWNINLENKKGAILEKRTLVPILELQFILYLVIILDLTAIWDTAAILDWATIFYLVATLDLILSQIWQWFSVILNLADIWDLMANMDLVSISYLVAILIFDKNLFSSIKEKSKAIFLQQSCLNQRCGNNVVTSGY